MLHAVTLAALALSTPALQDASDSTNDAVERIEAYLAPFVADGHLSGTILVAQGEDVLFERAFGMANHEHGVANTTGTRHGIASISKAMTMVIAIRLLEEGKIAIDDTLDSWLPDFPRADRITFEHLLRHRAGIPHRVTSEIEETIPRDAAMMVELAAATLDNESAFLCEPGETHNYSSAGFSVLARVLEITEGKSYDELLQQYVCEPAGMTDTFHADSRMLVPHRSVAYMPMGKTVRHSPLKDLSFLVGAGSALSTAADLMRFATATRTGVYGESVRQSLAGPSGFSSNGATSGFRAFVDHHPSSDVTVAVTANVTTGALNLLRDALPRIVAGEDVAVRDRLNVGTIEASAETLAQYEGAWESRPGSSFQARVEAGDLMVGSYVLVPTGEHSFFSYQDYSEVTFELDEGGDPAVMHWGGLAMRRLE